MTTELLSPLDQAFWHIESEGHPMHLGALGHFTANRPGAARHAARLLAERCAEVPQLRRRIGDVLFPLGAAAWRPDPDFDPSRHIHLVPAGRSDPDVYAVAGELMARPLERGRPPWEAYVLEGRNPAAWVGTPFAVLFKFHHALADGLGALALAATLFDQGAERTPPRRPANRTVPAQSSPAVTPELLLPDPRRLPGALLSRLHGRMQDVGQALEIGAAVARAGLPSTAPAALIADAVGGTRTIAGVRFDIDEVHLIRKSAGGTVNDVLIAVVAGALRRWLQTRGEPVRDVAPRALIPVSRRRPNGGAGGANRLSGYLIRLPVGNPDPLGRLAAVRADMDRNKEAGPARGAGAVALLADHVPALGHRLGGPVVAQAARLLYDVLVTSVPLPGIGLSLGGSTLRQVYPLAPLARGQSLAVAVSTYRGAVHFGLLADGGAVPDLAPLAQAVREELALLRRSTQ
ncbi:wax ester/triacylglycerol synthase family O-acyltransferase [Streptomyces sp. NPDC006879]|uniref:wax ester/triacylglycerol synthase family O-acyltransferase n=1 Tax=Streptomyces sp. NPDC006879 TaxID=3364767 RepID=UPI0036A4E02C